MNARTTLVVASLLAAGCAAHGTVRVKVALAKSLAERGQKDAAFEAADAACREAPDDGTARAIRGALLTSRGLLDEAEADLKDAVRLESRLPEAHAALAVLHERRQRPDEAAAEHRRAAELAPRDARYANNLGYALLVHGKPAEALPVLRQAARLDPMSPRIRNNLGFTYARLSDYPRAAHEFALGGTPAEAQNNLGFAYERAGNLAQARAHCEEGLRLDPDLAAARQNLSRVSAGPQANASKPAGEPSTVLANVAHPGGSQP